MPRLVLSRNIRNILWNIAEVTISPALFFISIPLFIHLLGKPLFGVWMLVNSFIIFSQIFNLGLPTATYKHVAENLPQKKWASIQSSINTNLSGSLGIFVWLILINIVLYWGISQQNWFIKELTLKSDVLQAMVLIPIVSLIKLLEQIIFNVFRALEEFKYPTWIGISNKTSTLLVNIGIAFYFKNIALILLSTITLGILELAICFWLLKRTIPYYQLQLSLNKKLLLKELNYAIFTWLQAIGVILVFQGDRLLIGYCFDLETLSNYAIVATLFNHIHMALTALVPWIFPKIAKVNTENNPQKTIELYYQIRNFHLLVSNFLLFGAVLFLPFFIQIWLGNSTFEQVKNYIVLFTAFQFVFSYMITPSFYLNAAGEEKLCLRQVALMTLLNIIGLLVGLFVFQSIEMMIIGLYTSTAVGVFFMHISVEKHNANPKAIVDTCLLLSPAILGSLMCWQSSFGEQFIGICCCLILLYAIFFHYFKTKFSFLS